MVVPLRRLCWAAVVPTVLAGASADEDARLDLGRELFANRTEPRCSICHSLSDAGATGEVGPNLDQLRPAYDVVLRAIEHGVGPMRPYDRLDPAERDALAYYVATVAGR